MNQLTYDEYLKLIPFFSLNFKYNEINIKTKTSILMLTSSGTNIDECLKITPEKIEGYIIQNIGKFFLYGKSIPWILNIKKIPKYSGNLKFIELFKIREFLPKFNSAYNEFALKTSTTKIVGAFNAIQLYCCLIETFDNIDILVYNNIRKMKYRNKFIEEYCENV